MREEIVEDLPWDLYGQDPLNALLRRQDGIISLDQAHRFLTRKAVLHRVARGRWRRVHRAVFCAYAGTLTVNQRHWIALLAVAPEPEVRRHAFGAGHAAYLGGLTALCAAGLTSIASPDVHVLIPHGRSPRAAAGVVHRIRDLAAEDCHPTAQPPLTLPGRSLVDAAQWARSDDEARLVIATSFQQRLVRIGDVMAVLQRRLSIPRRDLIARTAWDCAGGSHTLAELDFLTLCRRGDLPLPQRQLHRRDRTGKSRYLDACFDEYKVVVEIDGVHHADTGQRWDDQTRQNGIVLAGYVMLRYPGWVVREQPDRVIAELRQALINAGWRDLSLGAPSPLRAAPTAPNTRSPREDTY